MISHSPREHTYRYFKMPLNLYILLTFVTTLVVLPSGVCNKEPSIDKAAPEKLGDCQMCKILDQTFKQTLDICKIANYDACLEQNVMRCRQMVISEIQSQFCFFETKHNDQCQQMAMQAEELIEHWYIEGPEEPIDFYKSICIEKLKVCCPVHHYGKECMPCVGDHKNLCSGNGKCRGDGTRKGNGTCLCDDGYTNENCDVCATGYYLSYTDDNKMLCSPCHVACVGGCTDGTSTSCHECQEGFVSKPGRGCVDIDECEKSDRCKDNTYCVNILGSYICLECDDACDRCHGDGPDMCRKCAKGYSMSGQTCTMDNILEPWDEDEILSNTRYMTYVGFIVITVIIIQMSNRLGGFIGAMVVSYIIGAEYYCMINGHQGLVNMMDFNLMNLFRTL